MWQRVLPNSNLTSNSCDSLNGLKPLSRGQDKINPLDPIPSASDNHRLSVWWDNGASTGEYASDQSGYPPLPNPKNLKPIQSAQEGVSSAEIATAEPSQTRARDDETSEEDNSIDELLTQLLKISKKSPNGTQDASYESIKNLLSGRGDREGDAPSEDIGVIPQLNDASGQDYERISDGLQPFGDITDPHIALDSGELDLWASQDGNMQFVQNIKMQMSPDGDVHSANSDLTPEEEAAICALVPKLVRVSVSKPVRGVYLDRRRGLWRANWREGGKVKTKGFRIAQWGEHEARRKAIEVRKLMETRGCFLKLKAVAMGDATRELEEAGTFSRLNASQNSDLAGTSFEPSPTSGSLSMDNMPAAAAATYMNPSSNTSFGPFLSSKYWPTSNGWDSTGVPNCSFLPPGSTSNYYMTPGKADLANLYPDRVADDATPDDHPYKLESMCPYKTELQDDGSLKANEQTVIDSTPGQLEGLPGVSLLGGNTSSVHLESPSLSCPTTFGNNPTRPDHTIATDLPPTRGCRSAAPQATSLPKKGSMKARHVDTMRRWHNPQPRKSSKRNSSTKSSKSVSAVVVPTRVLPQRKSRGFPPRRRLE